jgi:dGTPase
VTKLDWKLLLQPKRLFVKTRQGDIAPPERHSSSRVSAFQEDISRICYSSAFRRLQSKTQVHAFPKTDYVRTRLTHSIEVATVGHRIATALAATVTSGRGRKFPRDFDALAIIDIVRAACFAHDIGNPPFGHAGEYALREWYRDNSNHSLLVDKNASAKAWRDFSYLDGNSLGFRILTNLQGWRQKGGLQLTYAVLGAFSKYPYTSEYASETKSKFGILYSEKAQAAEVFTSMGLMSSDSGRYVRHPLSYIVEAADDIAYLIADIEDAAKDKIISFHEARQVLKPIAEHGRQLVRYRDMISNRAEYSDSDRINYLRSGSIDALVDDVITTFLSEPVYFDIMSGNFNRTLLESCALSKHIDKLRRLCRAKIYVHKDKCEAEAAAFLIISKLLDIFCDAAVDHIRTDGKYTSVRNERVFRLLPEETRKIMPAAPQAVFQVIVDFISGMTDTYAMQLYRKLTGYSLPGYDH